MAAMSVSSVKFYLHGKQVEVSFSSIDFDDDVTKPPAMANALATLLRKTQEASSVKVETVE